MSASVAARPDKVQDRINAQAAARDRKRNKRVEPAVKPAAKQEGTIKCLHMLPVDASDTQEARSAAFCALQKAQTLQTYYHRFRYEDTQRRAVLQKEFLLEGPIPLVVAHQIEHELFPQWKRGKDPERRGAIAVDLSHEA